MVLDEVGLPDSLAATPAMGWILGGPVRRSEVDWLHPKEVRRRPRATSREKIGRQLRRERGIDRRRGGGKAPGEHAPVDGCGAGRENAGDQGHDIVARADGGDRVGERQVFSKVHGAVVGEGAATTWPEP